MWFLDFPSLGTLDVLNKQTRALNFFGGRADLLLPLFYELSKRAFDRDLPGPEEEQSEEFDEEAAEEEARAAEDRQLNAVLHGLCRAFSVSVLVSDEGGPSQLDLPVRVAEELTKRVWCGDVRAVFTLAKLLGRREEHARTMKENCSDAEQTISSTERNCSNAESNADSSKAAITNHAEESNEENWPSDGEDERPTTGSPSRGPPWLFVLQPELGRALTFFLDHGVAGESLACPEAIPLCYPFGDKPDVGLASSAIAARYHELHTEAYLEDPDGEKREILLQEHRLLRGPDSGRPLDVEVVFAAVLLLLPPPPLDLAEGFAKAEAFFGWRPRYIMWDEGALLYVAGNGITEPFQKVPAWELLEANLLDAATHVVCVRKLWRAFWENSYASPCQWFTDIVDDF
jgi:hypothetical protein